MDPLMGLVGSLVIGRWAYSLVRETAALLLDADIESEVVDALRSALQRDSSDLVSDLHVWHVGPGQLAAIAVIVTDAPRSPAEYKVLMQSAVELAHATVEVNRSSDGSGARVGERCPRARAWRTQGRRRGPRGARARGLRCNRV